jgi:ABC-2 type transport system permease protein
MPIHDLGYQHWSGQWTSHPYRWWVITRQGILQLIGKRRFLFLMALSAIPFVVRSVMLYAATVLGNLPFLKIDATFFRDFLSQQMFFTFLIAIYAGSGLVSHDLKANALQIYLAKPITRRDYLLGKLGVVAFFLTLPTLVPGLLLFVMAIAFQPSGSFIRDSGWVVVSILVYSLAIVLTNSLVVLAASSLTRSSRFAGINFAAVYLFSGILYGILSSILRTKSVAWVSLSNNLRLFGDLVFGTPSQFPGSPLWFSTSVLVAVGAGSAWLVYRRVKAVEVVR